MRWNSKSFLHLKDNSSFSFRKASINNCNKFSNEICMCFLRTDTGLTQRDALQFYFRAKAFLSISPCISCRMVLLLGNYSNRVEEFAEYNEVHEAMALSISIWVTNSE